MDGRRSAIENLSLYEGVMVGAYMNWLISFIDKLNVERAEAFRYYVLAETITISILILSLISYLLWTPRSWRLWGIHIISVGVIIALENMQNLQPNLLKLIIFYSVGILLWTAIQLTERIKPIYRLREN